MAIGSQLTERIIGCVHPVYLAQVMTYLKLTGSPAGLLLNFNVTSLRAGIRRLTHPDLYVRGGRPHQTTGRVT